MYRVLLAVLCATVVTIGSAAFLLGAVGAPVALFVYSPSSPAAGSPVAFDGSGSTCNSKPCSYRWTNDGDNSVLGAGMKPSLAFQQAGTKYVRLTVTDSRGRAGTVERDVVVSAQAGSTVAAFTYSPASPVAGSPVYFDGSSSSCFSSPCGYRWTDDADSSLLGTGITASYTFKGVGVKYVRLTVTDALSQVSSVEHDVAVASSTSTSSLPFITSFTPTNGSTGIGVAISGANFSGASAVKFNGVGAAFTISSSTTILTTVPSGAATGLISVTTAAGTATSSTAFAVAGTPPIANYTYAPSSPVTASPVSFDGSSSSCSATPCSYGWTDDADGSRLGTGAKMAFTFAQAGTKYVRLTITDAASQSASAVQNVVVSASTTPSNAFYVATTGNDANSGTSASPWRTIQKAANTLKAGQTVIVTAGAYSERVTLTTSGASGSPITFQAQSGVVMQGFALQANYVKVSGFEITNSPGTSYSDRFGGSGVYVDGSYDEVSSNYIHDTPASGVSLTSASGNDVVRSNRVVHCVQNGINIYGTNHLIELNDISHSYAVNGSDADGIRFFGSGTTVRKNYLHDMVLSDSPGQSPHIDAFQTWGPATNFVFEQNLIDKTWPQGFTIEGLTQPVGSIIIRNNVFITRGSGYQPDVNVGDLGLVTNVTIANNTMVALNGQVEYAVWIFQYMSGVAVKNNAVYNHGNSSTPYIRVDSGASGLDLGFNSVYTSNGVAPAGGPYSGDLWMINPLFLNLSGLDFHLQNLSPLVDRGINLSPVTNDYDSYPRPFGALTDMGAFEFHTP